MALGFIKKVFTFGKDKSADAPTRLTTEEKTAIGAESEPKDRHEDLPIAEDRKISQWCRWSCFRPRSTKKSLLTTTSRHRQCKTLR